MPVKNKLSGRIIFIVGIIIVLIAMVLLLAYFASKSVMPL